MTTLHFPMSRIEGHAKVIVDIEGSNVRSARFQAMEYRGFEQFLKGMPADQMPVVVPRICGVCSTAHHVVAVKALEDAYGVTPPPLAEKIRHLLMVGQLIQNQATSLFFFTLPDKLETSSIFQIKAVNNNEVLSGITRKAMAVRKIGTDLIGLAGGQCIHPVKAVIGGITSGIEASLAANMRKQIKETIPLACQLFDEYWKLTEKMTDKAANWEDRQPFYYMASVDSSDPTLSVDTMSIRAHDNSESLDFPASSYRDHLQFNPVKDSYAPQTSFKGQPIRANSLARVNMTSSMGTPIADKYLERFRRQFGAPAHEILLFDLCRGIELINGLERAEQLLAADLHSGERAVSFTPCDGVGYGMIEAPRGPLIHCYQIENGTIASAEFVIPTVHNSLAIERALTSVARHYMQGNQLDMALEQAIGWVVRAFDPCIACATH